MFIRTLIAVCFNSHSFSHLLVVIVSLPTVIWQLILTLFTRRLYLYGLTFILFVSNHFNKDWVAVSKSCKTSKSSMLKSAFQCGDDAIKEYLVRTKINRLKICLSQGLSLVELQIEYFFTGWKCYSNKLFVFIFWFLGKNNNFKDLSLIP